jgi:putative transposase
MSRKGDCWDNAVAESFFGIIKSELIHRERFTGPQDTLQAIFEYIEIYYNRKRKHSTLGYKTEMPCELRTGRLCDYPF